MRRFSHRYEIFFSMQWEFFLTTVRKFSHRSENGLRKVRKISYYSKGVFGLLLMSFISRQWELTELPPKHPSCNQTGKAIRDRHTDPHAELPVKPGKNQQARNQYKHLTRNRQKDSLARHADTLEEVGSHHLKTDNREKHQWSKGTRAW